MATHFYVSHDSQQMGPLSASEILHHVSCGELSAIDYVYDENKKDWILLIDHPDFAKQIKAMKPKAPPQPSVTTQAQPSHAVKPTDQEWFVLKGENRYGPFAYADVIKMLQQGVAFEFDFAWNATMSDWKRIAEIPDFSPQKIAALQSAGDGSVKNAFFKRRHRRVQYGGTILVHDNKKVWRAKAIEISEGGVGVIMENATVLPGQELFLHFKPGDGVPPFNATCEVVNKQYVNKVNEAYAPIRYGLKFLKVSDEVYKIVKGHEGKKNAA
jgi:hypothetical protein